MTCPECSGDVNVSCYYGAKLRCGCGRTIVDAPTVSQSGPPVGTQALDLLGLLAVLREHRVQRYRAGDLEITLAPEAYKAQAAESQASIPPEVCDCGHEVDAHVDSGCMNANCDPAVCEKWAEAQAERAA